MNLKSLSLGFSLILILLLMPWHSQAGIYINNMPEDITVKEGEAIDIPIFFEAKELTGKAVDLYVYKENLNGSNRQYLTPQGWVKTSQKIPLIQGFGPMYEYIRLVWHAFPDSKGMSSFRLTICLTGQVNDSPKEMCGQRTIYVQSIANKCGGLSLSSTQFTETLRRGETKNIDIYVKDSCGNDIDFDFSTSSTWLSLTKEKGILHVTLQTMALRVGTYDGIINVRANGQSKDVNISLTIKAPLILLPW